MRVLKQSTQIVVLIGPFLDKTDGVTEEAGLAGAGTEISKAGAAFGAGPTLGTLDSDGWYPITLTTTHTNTLGDLTVKVHDAATHLPVWAHFTVIPANAFDGLVNGTGVGVRADVQGWLGTAPATPTVNGVPEVDMTHLGGVAQSATDLKDFADDGYDPATNKVQGVVLTDTVTTYTGNTPQTGDSFARIGATGSGLTTLATQASVNTIDDFLDTEVASILAAVDTEIATIIATLGTAGAGLTDLGGMSLTMKAQVEAEATDALNAYDGPTNAELATALGTADDAVLAAIAALNNLSSAQVTAAVPTAAAIAAATVAKQLTETYAADGVAPTVEQALLLIQQMLTEFAISGTTLTLKKLDGSTSAATFTLSDATTPTSITRAS